MSKSFGARPSPPDVRDWRVEELIGAPVISAIPDQFFCAPMPMALDQNGFPSCTVMATTGMKLWQDFEDNGKRWPTYDWLGAWNDACRNYGADAKYGWYTRAALDYALKVGLKPVPTKKQRILRVWRDGYNRFVRKWWPRNATPAAFGGQPQKIAAYFSVGLAPEDMQHALMSLGPLVVAGPWDINWNYTGPGGVLKAPVGKTAGGHAWVIYGWVRKNGELFWYCQNSWGELYGNKGRFLLPDKYRPLLWEAWKSVDN